MQEAVEIAKLRFFLKLVSTRRPNYNKVNLGIEPLPDIDFNIKTGNTLVGFSSLEQLKNSLNTNIFSQSKYDEILSEVKKYSDKLSSYKIHQLNDPYDKNKLSNLKNELELSKRKLNVVLDEVYREFLYDEISDEQWTKNYAAFHWITEFWLIMNDNGGFDVIIGNPPFVRYQESNFKYKVADLKSIESSNLYSFVLEKALLLIKKEGKLGIVLPMSFVSGKSFKIIRDIVFDNTVFLSHFGDRPTSLFDGVHQNITLLLSIKDSSKKVYSSKFYHFFKAERHNIFDRLVYFENSLKTPYFHKGVKLGNEIAFNIFQKINSQDKRIGDIVSEFETDYPIFTSKGTGGYWLRTLDYKIENFYRINLNDKETSYAISGIMNSSLFYYYWRVVSDCRALKIDEIMKFPINLDILVDKNFIKLSKNYIEKLESTKEFRSGATSYDQFRPFKVKGHLDPIDKILSIYYNLSEKEINYIINYDYKYRMKIVSEK
jgi:hypothetical protein